MGRIYGEEVVEEVKSCLPSNFTDIEGEKYLDVTFLGVSLQGYLVDLPKGIDDVQVCFISGGEMTYTATPETDLGLIFLYPKDTNSQVKAESYVKISNTSDLMDGKKLRIRGICFRENSGTVAMNEINETLAFGKSYTTYGLGVPIVLGWETEEQE